jgi:hypothetical protein
MNPNKRLYPSMLDKDIINFVKEQDDACVTILNIRDGESSGKALLPGLSRG